MRVFVVLCLVAVAYADKLGYNYQPVGHSDAGLSFAPGGSGLGGDIGGLGGGLGGGIGSLGGGSGLSIGGGIGSGIGGGLGGVIGGGDIGGGSIGGGQVGGFESSAPAEFNKEFFSYSAPESEFDDNDAAQRIASSLKKNLRVVFIKAPENRGLENAALALAKQAADDKTAIYVLNKQADIGGLADRLNALRNNNNQRPDVHFVKYRTPEDAANAQRAIQAQYDSYPGSSQSHNGGVAPVINFASQAPVRAPTAHAPGAAYLPASIFRRRF